jgi:hypothetical protein
LVANLAVLMAAVNTAGGGFVALSEGKDRRPQDFHEESFEDRSGREQIILYRVLA